MKIALVLLLAAVAGTAVAVPQVRRAIGRFLRHSSAESPAVLSNVERSRWLQVTIVLWFAAMTCLAEMAYLTYSKEVSRFKVISFDYMWTVPAGYLLIFLPMVVLALRPSRRSLSAVVFLCTFVSALALLLVVVSGLYNWAAAVLAAGIALQMARNWRAHAWIATKVARSGVPLAAIVLVLAGVFFARPIVEERRRLAAMPPAPAGPNVLLIVLDTVGAKSLSLHGYERRTSPALDAFASKGLVFDRAYATAPWTLPSHGSMFTGRLPYEMSGSIGSPIDATHTTVAEVLQKYGYLTAGFVANPWYGESAYGLARGFQHYEDVETSLFTVLNDTSFGETVFKALKLRERLGTHDNLGRKSAEEVNGAFLDWTARAEPGRPFFAFLNYFDPHAPYLPPDPFATKFSAKRPFGHLGAKKFGAWGPDDVRGFKDAYDGAISYLDSQLNQLFRAIESTPRLRNTIVIITSDHGEQFGEHRLLEHVNSLYLALLHVPLVIVGPGVPPGIRIAEPVSLRDVAATILASARVDPSGTVPGRPLLSQTNDTGVVDAPLILAEVERTRNGNYPDWWPTQRGKLKSLISRDWQYIRNFGDGKEELFDLRADPFGLTDRSMQEPALLNEYRLRLDANREDICPAQMTTSARARIADVVAVAAWSGLAFGFCEGVLLVVSRAWPVVLAPYKASPHLLWLAPSADIVVFSIAAAGLWVALNWLGSRLRGQALRTVVSFFSAAGTATVGVSLNVLHPASVAVLAAGVGVATWRGVAGRESALIAAMRRRMWLIPIALVVIALGVEGYMRLSEALTYAALPPARSFP